MSKIKLKKQFLDELKKIPIIQVACEKSGISRQTLYRWKRESKEFTKEVEDAITEGVLFVNDMSESQLLNLIKEKSFPALSFWLRHRHDSYKNKLEVKANLNIVEELSKEQEELVTKTLKMVGVILNKDEYGE